MSAETPEWKFNLRDVREVRFELISIFNALTRGDIGSRRAKVLIENLNVLLSAIKLDSLDARLTALEGAARAPSSERLN